jgi:hypothetical protein
MSHRIGSPRRLKGDRLWELLQYLDIHLSRIVSKQLLSAFCDLLVRSTGSPDRPSLVEVGSCPMHSVCEYWLLPAWQQLASFFRSQFQLVRNAFDCIIYVFLRSV